MNVNFPCLVVPGLLPQQHGLYGRWSNPFEASKYHPQNSRPGIGQLSRRSLGQKEDY
jgi:hypothetical protein